jgi:thymidylate synthase
MSLLPTYASFTEAYLDQIRNTYERPEHESSPRGMKVKEVLGASFRITDPRDRLPRLKGRGFNVSYVIAEAIWYLAGLESTSWIANYSKFWNDISDDGLTANSAYGARIFKPHGRIAKDVNPLWTQWQYIIEELTADPDSRRAVVHIRSPHDSLLAKKDVPCTLTLQFLLRDDKLHLVVSMRSNDIILGMPNDVPAFTLFQELMALELSEALSRPIEPGHYTHQGNSIHAYERHFGMVETILASNTGELVRSPMPRMPGRPPLERLLSFEARCRVANSAGELETLLDNVGLHPYYHDWCILLALHRVKRLSYEIDQSDRFLGRLTYRGYDLSKE